MKRRINVVWFKRDLRLSDHAPLKSAIATGQPTLLLYIFEPILLHDEHFSERHWRFVVESLRDMNSTLPKPQKLCIRWQSALRCFEDIAKAFKINTVYSHQEIGLASTFERDKQLSQWFKKHGISWQQTPQGAVIRGSVSRHNWDKHWQDVMRSPLQTPNIDQLKTETFESHDARIPSTWQLAQPLFQQGGSQQAWQTLDSFYEGRGKRYHTHISKPLQSQNSCSRISPYLAWGNISLREAYQHLLAHWQLKGWRRQLQALSSRLHWHCHFIQKFESECEMEIRPVNKGYLTYRYNEPIHIGAWLQGKTGIPLIDACMQCLQQTGYINFRMRAMLVSFLCHHLHYDWRLGVKHLASLFLDFEPGIHYTQFQMQAGVTGTNTLRIYNPVKQSLEHDPEAHFIKQWLPELRSLPNELAHQPWLITPMESAMLGVELPAQYLNPIVDLEQSAKNARKALWTFRAKPDVKRENARIVARHVRPSR